MSKKSNKPSTPDIKPIIIDDSDRFRKPTKKEIDAIPADIKKQVEDALKQLKKDK